MFEKIKENWFVALVAVVLIIATGYVAIDANTGKLPGKKVDGKDVVATIGDEVIFADDLFTDLYGDEASKDSIGTQILYMYFERAVADAAIATDSDLKVEVAQRVTAVKQYYAGKEQQLVAALNQSGYSSIDDLEDYFTHFLKLEKIIHGAYDADIDALFTPIHEEKKSRIVSHILIKCADPENPTDEEKEKMNKVETALSEGKDFKEVAKEFSDDGSAAEGGFLGYVDSDTQFVKEFKEAMLAQEKGVVGDWVKTQFGFHKILVNETDKDAILNSKDPDVRRLIYEAIDTANPKLSGEIIWKTSKDLNVTFLNENVEKALKSYLGVEEKE